MMLTEMPMVYAGGGFPWGLLIIGGILYLLWRNGAFERFTGPGGPGRHGHGPYYGGYNQGQGQGQSPARMPQEPGYPQGEYNAQRQAFDEWHRQAHESHGAQAHAPSAPAAPAAPAPEAPAPGTGEAPR